MPHHHHYHKGNFHHGSFHHDTHHISFPKPHFKKLTWTQFNIDLKPIGKELKPMIKGSNGAVKLFDHSISSKLKTFANGLGHLGNCLSTPLIIVGVVAAGFLILNSR